MEWETGKEGSQTEAELSSCPAVGGWGSILQDLLRRLLKCTLEVLTRQQSPTGSHHHRSNKVASQALKLPDCTPGDAKQLPAAGPSQGFGKASR